MDTRSVARGVFAFGILLASVGTMFSNAAVAEPIAMKFYVYVSGIKAMKVKFRGDLQHDSYSGAASLKPKGLAGLFIRKKMHLEVKGRFNDRHVLPIRFSIRAEKKKKVKTATVTWNESTVPASWKRTPPPDAAWQKEVRAAVEKGAIDPLSMLFAIGVRTDANPCHGKMRVFDGLTVFDIRLAAVREEKIRNMNYNGPALKCRLIYVPVAGMSEKKKRKRLKRPPTFTVWLARVKSSAQGKVWMPVQAAGKSKGRPFTATLVDASLGGGPLRAAR